MLHFALGAGEELSFVVEVEEDSVDKLADLVDEQEDVLDVAFVHLHLHSWLDDDGDAVAHKGHDIYPEVLLHGWSPRVVLVVRGDHDVDDCTHRLFGSRHVVGGLG